MAKGEEAARPTLEELRRRARDLGLRGAGRLSREALEARLTRAEELRRRPVAELRDLARQVGLEGADGWRKAELVARLAEVERPTEPTAPAPPGVWLGRLMRGVGTAGVVVSLLALLLVPWGVVRLGARAAQSLQEAASQAEAAAGTLALAGDSLRQGARSLASAAEGLEVARRNLQNTRPALESIGSLVGEEAATTVEATHQALLSAQESARAVDQVLRGLAALGPLTGVTYDPDQPLEESLATMAVSLEPLPGSLRAVQADLQRATQDLAALDHALGQAGEQVAALAEDLTRLGSDLEQRAEGLQALARALERAAAAAPRWGWALGGLSALGLAWLALWHAALLWVGDRVLQEGWPGAN